MTIRVFPVPAGQWRFGVEDTTLDKRRPLFEDAAKSGADFFAGAASGVPHVPNNARGVNEKYIILLSGAAPVLRKEVGNGGTSGNRRSAQQRGAAGS